MNLSPAFLIDDSDLELVNALVCDQFPQYSGLEVSYAATGWDNVIFRLGEHLSIRLPRRTQALEPQTNEIRWLNQITEPLTIPHPTIKHVATPSPAFPFPWTIVNWMEGIRSMSIAPGDRSPGASELGTQLALLHKPAPSDAPLNPFRGNPLRARHDVILKRMEEVPALRELRGIWDEGVNAPEYPGSRVWCHGDIHPGNYLLNPDGTLAGIIDFGDVTQGDPAVDLGTAWASFDAEGRKLFFSAYLRHCSPEIAADEAVLTRAKSWVIATTISAVLASDLSTPDFIEMAHWAKFQLLGK